MHFTPTLVLFTTIAILSIKADKVILHSSRSTDALHGDHARLSVLLSSAPKPISAPTTVRRRNSQKSGGGCDEVGPWYLNIVKRAKCSKPKCKKNEVPSCTQERVESVKRRCTGASIHITGGGCTWENVDGFKMKCKRVCSRSPKPSPTSGGTPKPAPTPGGSGEPHMRGFDGSRFDFQGVGGAFYSIFGREGGDSLVAQMRQKPLKSTKHKKVTFFNKFGLTVGSSRRKVQVSFTSVSNTSSTQEVLITSHGEIIDSEMHFSDFNLSSHEDKKNVTLITTEVKYIISAKSMGTVNVHFDIGLELLRPATVPDRYLGVLGLTLNRALGYKTKQELSFHHSPSRIDKSLMKEFQVSSLFQPIQSSNLKMDGIASLRMASTEPHHPTHSTAFTRSL